jgi:hypothetical protein
MIEGSRSIPLDLRIGEAQKRIASFINKNIVVVVRTTGVTLLAVNDLSFPERIIFFLPILYGTFLKRIF